jgi:hypothetical protein
MEKSYDENLAKLMSEARDLFKSASYAESARKYLEAARNQEATRGIAQAEDLYHEAIRNFIRASEENKEKKQFRMSAQNLYYVVYIFRKLKAEEDWKAATKAVVDDLVNAAQEYLLWNEYDRGIIFISTACFFLFSIEDFKTAEQLYKQYIEQIKDDPGFTRAQQVLYSAGHAIKAVKDLDTSSLLNAQQLVGGHLKPGLSQIMGELFFPALDEAMDTVTRIFRSKIKLPKIVPELKISRDLVLSEPTDFSIHLENEGDGDAFNLSFRLDVPDGVEIIEGDKEFTVEQLLAHQTYEQKLIIRCISSSGEISHELNASIAFYDQLQTKQTMMIGPYDLVFREKSLVREIEKELNELSDQNTALQEKMSSITIIPEDISSLMIEMVSTIAKESKELLVSEEFETIQANIKNIRRIHETIDKVSSKEFLDRILGQRQELIDEEVNKAKEVMIEQFEKEKEALEQDKIKELDALKIVFEEEKQQASNELNEQKEKEQNELISKLDEERKKEIDELEAEHNKNLELALAKQSEKFEEEKKNVLQEQEAVLRNEFQKLLADSQGKKRR